MKTSLFLVALLCFLNSAFATNYYFSAISGDDSRTSTQAQNSSTPWKTLNKLNSFFSSLKPGDFVLLKRGETFYGSITVTKSGTSSSPITIGAYGTGNKPIITSLVKFSNWVSKGNGIWESYNSSLGSKVNIVLLDDVEQEMGRYPNSNAANSGYLIYESHVGKTSITDNELTSVINWTGAELVTRPRRWILNRSLITAHSGGKISYSTSSIYEPYDKYGYFIQNSIKTLDKLGEWYFSPSTKKLSMYFGSNSPTSYVVQATTKDYLVSSNNFSYIVFDNLTIKGSNNLGFNIRSGSGINIKNSDILFSGEDGVVVASHTNFKIENCTVSNSNNNGVDLGAGANYATLRNTKILNTALWPGLAQSGDGNGIAVRSNGNGNIVERNEIRKTGYTSLTFNGSDVSIRNNLIDSFCLIKDDGAGIYSNGTSVVFKNRKITGNIVMNGIGISNGTDNPSKLSVSGIYMDNEASAAEISGNAFANCNFSGIYIHNCAGMVIKNNTLFNNNLQLNFIQESDHPSSMRNNTINSNIMFSKNATQLVSSIKSYTDDISYFGKFDSNYYARPLDDRITIYNYYPGSTTNMDLSGWKSKYSKDPASKITAKQVAAYKINSLIGSNKFANGSLTSAISGVYASSCSILLSLSGLLDGGYLQVTPSATKSNVYMNIGGITSGKKYIVKYSVKGSVNNNMVINAFLRQGGSPYAVLTPMQGRKVSTTRSENEMIFIAPSTQSSAQLVLQVDQNARYYLDNIKVYEADAVITNPSDSIKFVYNVSTVSKDITLDGDYIDAKGKTFSKSITLLPYASAVLIRNGGATSTTSATSPTVSITSPSNNANYTAPATISITAAATDADGTISQVEFLIGGKHLYTSNDAPYKCTWRNVPAGTYVLTAKATDNSGRTTTSSSVTIVVGTATLARGTASSEDAALETMLADTAIAVDNSIVTHDSTAASVSTTSKASTVISQPPPFNEPISLKVGPNPATNDLYIYTNGLPQNKKPIISVFSISGVLVKTIQPGNTNQVVQLNVSSFSRGVYIVRVICGDSVLSKQFIKQ